MKCIICHGEEIVSGDVFEEIAVNSDIVRLWVNVLVCQTCGERYYDRATMRRLERVREELTTGRSKLEQVGRILQIK